MRPSRFFRSATHFRTSLIAAALLAAGGVALLAASPSGEAAPASNLPSEMVGQASVIDADTIEIRGTRIRLEGVDAPESGQRCRDAQGTLYRCGAAAANALDAWINRQPVTCTIDGQDRYKRLLGTCTARGESVQDWLVRSGHALAFRKYSTRYVEAELAARDARVGVWSGDFVAPWDWRKGERLEGEKRSQNAVSARIATPLASN